MQKILYKGFIICFATMIVGCSTTNGTAEVDIYESTPVYVPTDRPESPELFDLPRSYEPGSPFYDQPLDELYY